MRLSRPVCLRINILGPFSPCELIYIFSTCPARFELDVLTFIGRQLSL